MSYIPQNYPQIFLIAGVNRHESLPIFRPVKSEILSCIDRDGVRELTISEMFLFYLHVEITGIFHFFRRPAYGNDQSYSFSRETLLYGQYSRQNVTIPVTNMPVSKVSSWAHWNNLMDIFTSVCFSSKVWYSLWQIRQCLSLTLNFPKTILTPFKMRARINSWCRSFFAGSQWA